MLMDNPDSPLVLTKLRVPAARPNSILRARLVERLTPQIGTRLILVCAPAGYGKTTLLTAWGQSLLHKGIVVSWVALEASDDSPVAFGGYLLASLMQALGPLPGLVHAAQLLRSTPEMDLQRALPLVINAIAACERTCVLVLDDYHLIGAPAVHSALAYLVERLPENMHVAIGSRSNPPLPLARLRARGQLLELRGGDLRFTEDEARQFLNEVMRLELSAQGIAALAARTEGWIAGLQLAALSLSGKADRFSKAGTEDYLTAFTGSHRYLVEYLLEEVFLQQPPEVQVFLLSTSILERLCGSLCDSILSHAGAKHSGSDTILAALERANLFVVALDDQGCWYRYHHLFRDFLQTRLSKTQPERVAALHHLASEWYAVRNYLNEAVEHALKAARYSGDWSYAAGLVERHSYTMMAHSEIATIYAWCAAFPEELITTRPQLCILQAWTLVLGLRRQNRDKAIERLRQAEEIAALVEDRQQAGFLLDQIPEVRGYLALLPNPAADARGQLALAVSRLAAHVEQDAGRFNTLLNISYTYLALQETQQAAESLEAARACALSGQVYFGMAEATFRALRLWQAQGQLRRAEELYAQVRAEIASLLPHPEQELPGIGALEIALGCVHLEQDRLEEAERELLHGLELIGWAMNPYYLLAACLSLFRLRQIQGRSSEALEYLTRLEESWPDITFLTRALRLQHHLRLVPDDRARLDEAMVWSQDFIQSIGDGDFLPGMGPFGASEAYYQASLCWCQFQIKAGHPQAARAYLGHQLERAQMNGLTARLIELSLLESLAWSAEGDSKRTWQALERALEAGQRDGMPIGFVRSFDQGSDLERLLLEAERTGVGSPQARQQLKRILAVIHPVVTMGEGPSPSQVSPLAGGGQALSERELEVLHLVAQGTSNQQIAAQLFISVGTVKSHLNHILTKLDAHNRTEAVVLARASGLL